VEIGRGLSLQKHKPYTPRNGGNMSWQSRIPEEYKTRKGNIDKRQLRILFCDCCCNTIGVKIDAGIIINGCLFFESGSIKCECGNVITINEGKVKQKWHGQLKSSITDVITFVQKTRYEDMPDD
jgi:hypothetical protein